MSGRLRNVKSRLAAVFACALLLSGWAAEVLAQRYRVRVYNPVRHSRTRRAMSDRAAARAALKKKKRKAAARRAVSRQPTN